MAATRTLAERIVPANRTSSAAAEALYSRVDRTLSAVSAAAGERLASHRLEHPGTAPAGVHRSRADEPARLAARLIDAGSARFPPRARPVRRHVMSRPWLQRLILLACVLAAGAREAAAQWPKDLSDVVLALPSTLSGNDRTYDNTRLFDGIVNATIIDQRRQQRELRRERPDYVPGHAAIGIATLKNPPRAKVSILPSCSRVTISKRWASRQRCGPPAGALPFRACHGGQRPQHLDALLAAIDAVDDPRRQHERGSAAPTLGGTVRHGMDDPRQRRRRVEPTPPGRCRACTPSRPG